MSTRHEYNLIALRARLLSTLKSVRAGRSHDDMNSEFYIALGLIGAAVALDAICIDASNKLHDLALNASQHRAAELTAISRAERQAARQRAAV